MVRAPRCLQKLCSNNDSQSCSSCTDPFKLVSRSQIAWAALLPLFVLVPIIRVFFDYFPFVPNKWVGLGFVIYYLIATPSIYVHLVSPQTCQAFHTSFYVTLQDFCNAL